MSKSTWRIVSLVALYAAAASVTVAGLNGWVLLKGSAEIPIHFLGALLGIAAVLGSCGVNIWLGGPLDPKLDSAS